MSKFLSICRSPFSSHLGGQPPVQGRHLSLPRSSHDYIHVPRRDHAFIFPSTSYCLPFISPREFLDHVVQSRDGFVVAFGWDHAEPYCRIESAFAVASRDVVAKGNKSRRLGSTQIYASFARPAPMRRRQEDLTIYSFAHVFSTRLGVSLCSLHLTFCSLKQCRVRLVNETRKFVIPYMRSSWANIRQSTRH